MCWMTIRHDESGDAAVAAVEALRRGERVSGGHSWGLAVPDGDTVRIETGVGELPPRAEGFAAGMDADVALGHTRFATRGEITKQNAHPFAIHDREGAAVAALGHNGTWYDAPDTERADSFYIARLVESLVHAGHSLERAVREAGTITGETLLALHADGEAVVHSGRFEITATGETIASTGGTPIPDGEVRVI